MRDFRIAASISETCRIDPYPSSGSIPFTTSIIPSSACFEIAVMNPASPIIDFSISALQGQTVTQWPQNTQLDSLIDLPPSHNTLGLGSSHRIESVSLTWRF